MCDGLRWTICCSSAARAVDLAPLDQLVDRRAAAGRTPRRSGPRRGTPGRAAGAPPGRTGRAASSASSTRRASSGRARAEAGLREPQRRSRGRPGAARRASSRQLDRARVVLLDDVDARRGREQPRAARPRAQRLLEQLQRLGEQALLDQLVGDRARTRRRPCPGRPRARRARRAGCAPSGPTGSTSAIRRRTSPASRSLLRLTYSS